MADRPIGRLGGKTPLMTAVIPNINSLCAKSRTGKLITVPAGMHPGSEVANLGVLGYDVKEVYQGRGVLEAASMGIEVKPEDLAMRCNLICIENEKIKNHSAGHITTEEGAEIIKTLNQQLATDDIKFYPGVSYRHILIFKNGLNKISCTPPHDVPGTPFRDVLIKPTDKRGKETSDLLNNLILKSQVILKNHPVNIERIKKGKDPANSIWPWSPGNKPKMKTLKEMYGLTGAVISAVDLIQGIGVYAGMEVIKVKGATGLYDTNYEGKAKAAIEAIKKYDFVYLHIEASDEAGHEGNVDLKIKTLEYLDKRVVKYIVEETGKINEKISIAILPDHATPCEVRTHTNDAVPFLIYNPDKSPDNIKEYNENSTEKGCFGLLKGDEFIKKLISDK